MNHGVCMFEYVTVGFCLPTSRLALRRLATIKKSIRLREEALAKEEVKSKSKQSTSADKLRKILKEEKR